MTHDLQAASYKHGVDTFMLCKNSISWKWNEIKIVIIHEFFFSRKPIQSTPKSVPFVPRPTKYKYCPIPFAFVLDATVDYGTGTHMVP